MPRMEPIVTMRLFSMSNVNIEGPHNKMRMMDRRARAYGCYKL